jgi:hypothetical protein
MSKTKSEERRWKEFERQLEEAIKKDEAMSEEQRRAWLDTLPEHVPPPTGKMVTVIFMGADKRTAWSLRRKKRKKVRTYPRISQTLRVLRAFLKL